MPSQNQPRRSVCALRTRGQSTGADHEQGAAHLEGGQAPYSRHFGICRRAWPSHLVDRPSAVVPKLDLRDPGCPAKQPNKTTPDISPFSGLQRNRSSCSRTPSIERSRCQRNQKKGSVTDAPGRATSTFDLPQASVNDPSEPSASELIRTAECAGHDATAPPCATGPATSICSWEGKGLAH